MVVLARLIVCLRGVERVAFLCIAESNRIGQASRRPKSRLAVHNQYCVTGGGIFTIPIACGCARIRGVWLLGGRDQLESGGSSGRSISGTSDGRGPGDGGFGVVVKGVGVR